MKAQYKIVLIIILLVPIWIFLRAGMIRQEGPKIVTLLEAYRVKNRTYPVSLRQIRVKSLWHPLYFYDRKKDRFTLMYSIFYFARWYYSSEVKTWKKLD